MTPDLPGYIGYTCGCEGDCQCSRPSTVARRDTHATDDAAVGERAQTEWDELVHAPTPVEPMTPEMLGLEVRTTSATGGMKGVKPQRYDLLPKDGLDAIAEVFCYGASKYADHNWRLGYEWSKHYAATMRHMTAFWDGEDLDPESGLSHLAHAGFHVMALLTHVREGGIGGTYDDRWHSRARKASTPQ